MINREKDYTKYFQLVENEVRKHVIGQNHIIKDIFTAAVAGGNALMEGNPGLGKTVLVKTLGKVLDLPFSRIQFTPDLMPVDIIGTDIIKGSGSNLELKFEKGPIFSSLVMADEINRATPKTQSAMLEAMQEKTVTVGNSTYGLPEPFFVLATQNPLEMEGTYPLPEAQLDRFMFKLKIEMPDRKDLAHIMEITVGSSNTGNTGEIKKIISGEEIIAVRDMAMKIPMPINCKERAIELMMQTHPEHSDSQMVKDYVKYGSSPRGAQAIIAGAKVRALSEGRFNVSIRDIDNMALVCLRHRVFLNFRAMAENVDSDLVIGDILKKVK